MTKTLKVGDTVRFTAAFASANGQSYAGIETTITSIVEGASFPYNVVDTLSPGTRDWPVSDDEIELIETEIVPTAPANPVTKIDKIKAHLLSGRSLTQLEALGLYGAFRLAARIHDLKGQGWKIVSTIKEDPNGNPYAEYKLRTVKGRG